MIQKLFYPANRNLYPERRGNVVWLPRMKSDEMNLDHNAEYLIQFGGDGLELTVKGEDLRTITKL